MAGKGTGFGHEGPAHAEELPGARTLTDGALAVLFGDSDRWFLWSPVLLAAGIGAYFALSFEPNAALAALVAGIGCGGLALWRAPRGFVAGVAVFLIATGFTLAKLRTVFVAAPVLPLTMQGYEVAGWIEDTSGRGDARVRLLIRVAEIEGMAVAETPFHVRITAPRSRISATAGDFVRVRAALGAPPAPTYPGAFDFARQAWFERLGGVGFAYSRIEPEPGAETRPLSVAFATRLEALRHVIAARIRKALPGENGAFATALITGERGGLPEQVIDRLRDSGLAHLLAISGLHMMLMAGSLFWIVRALLAIPAGLALSYPIKKWAAATALLGGLGYLLLSGAAVSTQRAFIMIAVMFLAVLLDRPAITMRNLAFAALIILVLRPESLLNVSFQMSFATVVALVAAYEAQQGRLRRATGTGARGMPARAAAAAGFYLGGVVLTTIIATIATAPIAAFHFNRVALYGVLGNLLAVPLVGLMVMPMAGVALVAMPFGLESWPLQVMGLGLDAVIAVAAAVSDLPGAVRIVDTAPLWAVLLFFAGGLWLCLWRLRWRLIGAVPAGLGLAGCFLGGLAPGPDILIERQMKNVAVRADDGRLALLSARAGRYSAERWLLADGDAATLGEAAKRDGFRCDPLGCAARMANGRWLAMVRHPAIIAEECRRADVVVSAVPIRSACPGPEIVIGHRALRRGGSHAVRWHGGRYEVMRANDLRGRRPWVKGPPGGGTAAGPEESGSSSGG